MLAISVMVVMFTQYFNVINEGKGRGGVAVYSNCIPQKHKCNMEFSNLYIEALFDENIYYLKPFEVSVWVEKKESVEIESVQLDFKMKGMDMGVNRFNLVKGYSKNKKQLWKGKPILPVCVSGRAGWNVEISINSINKRYNIIFPVIVKKQQ